MDSWTHPSEYWDAVEEIRPPRDYSRLNALGFPIRDPNISHLATA